MAGERKIKLVIEVDSKDVDETQRSLDRLGLAAKKVGNDGKTGLDDLTKSAGGLAAGFNPVTAIITALTVGFTVFLAVTVRVSSEIYNLAKAFADYVKEVDNAREKTGLSIEILSALKMQAERTGDGFDSVLESVKNFFSTIAAAANGSSEAQAKLHRLGIDGKAAINDLDGSFKQVINTILNLPPGIARAAAAQDAFGDSGQKLIPFLRSFNGNIDELIVKAREMGLVLSVEDVKAAQEFDKAFKDIQNIVRGVYITFGREFLPIVVDVFRQVGDWLKQNKGEVTSWASYSANAVRGLLIEIKEIGKWWSDNWWWIRLVLAGSTLGVSEAMIFSGNQLKGYVNNLAENGGRSAPNYQNQYSNQPPTQTTIDQDVSSYFGDINKAKAEAEKLRKEREAYAKAEVSAQLSLLQNHLQSLTKNYTDVFSAIKEKVKETNDPAAYKDSFDALKTWYSDEVNKLSQPWADLLQQQDNLDKKTQSERILRRDEFQNKFKESYNKITESEKEFQKIMTDISKKLSEEQIRIKEQEVRRIIEIEKASKETVIARQKSDLQQGKMKESDVLKNELDYGLSNLNFAKTQLEELSKYVEKNSEKYKELRHEIKLLDLQIEGTKYQTAQKAAEFIAKETEDAAKQLKSYTDLLADLNDKTRESSEITELERVSKVLLTDTYKNLTEAQKANILAKAEEVDAYKETQKQLEEYKRLAEETHRNVRGFFADSLTDLIEDGWNGLFKSLRDRFKRFLIDAAADFLTSQFFQIFKGGQVGGNGGSQSSGGGFSIGNIFGGLFGGGGNGTPSFAGASGTGGGFSIPTFNGTNLNLGGGGNPFSTLNLSNSSSQSTGGAGGAGGGMWDGWLTTAKQNKTWNDFIKQQGTGAASEASGGFLSKILGNKGASFLSSVAPMLGMSVGGAIAGNDSAIGGLLGNVGGLAGGLLGSALLTGGASSMLGGIFASGTATSAAGMLSIGGLSAAMSATVVLAPVAAALMIGGWLLSRNAKRRKEEGIRDQAMRDSLDALNEIKSKLEKRPPQIDPETAIEQSRQVEATYFNEMNQLTDKKTRGIAIKDGNERVRPLVQQIRTAADAAKAFNINRQNTQNQFIGEFSTGVYMDNNFRNQYDDFKRYNGMLPGAFTGKDYIKAKLADGEGVFRPDQMERMRQAAGFDVVAYAGLPNYPKPMPPISKPLNLNTGGFIGNSTPSNSNKTQETQVVFGKDSIVINLNGKRITDAEIESIAINGVNKFQKNGGRK